MDELYHGSFINNLKVLEPHKSTHGEFVYATPYKELAIIFSKNCGDDLTYSLYGNKNHDRWHLKERIPYAFETMFNNSASIYTVSSNFFKDYNTGFSELMSDKSVKVLDEYYIKNVFNEIKNLEKEGKLVLTYYNKDILYDESLLESYVQQRINQAIRYNRLDNLNKNSFHRILLLHPEAMPFVNIKMQELNMKEPFYTNDDLLYLYNKMMNTEEDIYNVKKFTKSIKESFNEICPQLISSH